MRDHIRKSIEGLLLPTGIGAEYGNALGLEKNTPETRKIAADAIKSILKRVADPREISVDVGVDDETGRIKVVITGPRAILGRGFPLHGAESSMVVTGNSVFDSDRFIRVRGRRCYLATQLDVEADVNLVLRLDTHDDGKVSLGVSYGAITGHERCFVDDDFVKHVVSNGWHACAGTRGRYDSLFIPAEEMRRALIHFELIDPNHTWD